MHALELCYQHAFPFPPAPSITNPAASISILSPSPLVPAIARYLDSPMHSLDRFSVKRAGLMLQAAKFGGGGEAESGLAYA